MYEDEPHDRVHDVLAEAIHGEHPLGRRVLGRAEVIASIPVDRDRGLPRRPVRRAEHRRRRRRPRRPRPDRGARNERLSSPRRPTARGIGGGPPSAEPRLLFYPKETEQYHICFGGPGIARADERRYALGVLDAIFGGSVSSRLFREVREKRGLAYSVGSYTEQFVDTGVVAMYVGTRADNVAEACEVIGRELGRLHADGRHRRRARRAPRSTSRAGWCSASSRPPRGCRGSRAPSSLTFRCSRSTSCSSGSTSSPPTTSASWPPSSTTRRSSPRPASAPTRSCFRTAAGYVNEQLVSA